MGSRLTTKIAVALVAVVGLGGSVLVSPRPTPRDITLEPAPLAPPTPEAPRWFRADVTAYSSSPDETWGDPLITSSGRPVGEGVIACPRRFPFGTRFRIGSGVYTCWDRLHQRYNHRFDIWKESKQEALEFGRRRLLVEVL